MSETYFLGESGTTAGSSFTLTEDGSDGYTQQETGNTVDGTYSQTETGTDGYTMTETGTNATGDFVETVSGTDAYNLQETGNTQTGTFSRTEGGSGAYDRQDTGSGATLPTDSRHDQLQRSGDGRLPRGAAQPDGELGRTAIVCWSLHQRLQHQQRLSARLGGLFAVWPAVR